MAIAFAREGADALIAYPNEHDDARGQSLEKEGRKALLVAGDLKIQTVVETSYGAWLKSSAGSTSLRHS